MASTDEILDAILELAKHLRVAHQLPGRVRLKLLPTGEDLAKEYDRKGAGIDAAIASIDGVHAIRLNRLARSVVVEYDPKKIPADLWQEVVHLRAQPDGRAEIRAKLRSLLPEPADD